MTKTTRRLATAVLMLTTLAGSRAVAAADADGESAGGSVSLGHVRTTSPTLKAALDTAMQRSATFRAMVATIDASDGYVFIVEGYCSHTARACFVDLKSSGRYRFMYVEVDPSKPDWDLMGSIGHELRHTIEVISEPAVRTSSEKYFLYQRIGWEATGGNRETIAAIDAGNAVRDEVRKANRHATSE